MFLCLWDSRDTKNHYTQKEWPTTISFNPGLQNIEQTPLIKCFEYLQQKFPNISDAKVQEGVSNGPQVHKMLNDQNFIKVMNKKEEVAWTSIKNVVENYLGNHKSENFKKTVADLMKNSGKLGCLMNLC